jgi:hypothetical protein
MKGMVYKLNEMKIELKLGTRPIKKRPYRMNVHHGEIGMPMYMTPFPTPFSDKILEKVVGMRLTLLQIDFWDIIMSV